MKKRTRKKITYGLLVQVCENGEPKSQSFYTGFGGTIKRRKLIEAHYERVIRFIDKNLSGITIDAQRRGC